MIDLHTHSTASDGTDTPAELVARAASLNLEALAITDHDTLQGSDEALPLAAAAGLRFVQGLELSTRRIEEPDPAARSVHMLGYFFQPPDPGFRAWLDSLKQRRRSRNHAMAQRLQSLGMDVSLEEAEAEGSNITGRPHFAAILIRKGYVRSYSEAFRKLLGELCPAYVEREDPTPQEGIARIRQAGGVAVLAHAVRLNKSGSEEQDVLRALVDAGLGGIEVYHSDHDERSRSRYSQFAEKYGLAVTGGSDYHGAHKPDILLGRGRRAQRPPLSLLDGLRRVAGHR
ncbi:MAG: PHP domain-containing protein [Acidobacteria bacterium]|nr:PHP domain-containing protein [Acidobacteriota bacterium]